MRFNIEDLQGKSKVFLGDADSYTQIISNVNKLDFERKLKLAVLLFDHVIFAAAYFWQSQNISSSIRSLFGALLESGDILPSIRNECRDVVDYYEKRLQETKSLNSIILGNDTNISALSTEIAKPEHKIIAKDINNIGTFVYTSDSVETKFRSQVIYDINGENNFCSIKNIIRGTEYCKEVLSLLRSVSISDLNFSRAYLWRHINNLQEIHFIDNELKVRLLDRLSTLYLKANAIACDNSELLLTAYNTELRSTITTSNINLFLSVLELCGLTKEYLDKMSGYQISILKRSNQFIAFRTVYKRLIESVNVEEHLLFEAIRRKIIYTTRKEYVNNLVMKTIGTIKKASGPLFYNIVSSILPTDVSTAVKIMAGGGAALVGNSLLDKIEIATPILDFKEYVIKELYIDNLRKKVVMGPYNERY